MNNRKIVYIVYLIENVSMLILVGFLCWLFKSLWGLLLLLFINTGIKSSDEKMKGDKDE